MLVDQNDSSGALPQFQVVTGVRVLVPDARVIEARDLLAASEFASGDGDQGTRSIDSGVEAALAEAALADTGGRAELERAEREARDHRVPRRGTSH